MPTAALMSFWKATLRLPIIPFISALRSKIITGTTAHQQCSTNSGWIQRFKHTIAPVSPALLVESTLFCSPDTSWVDLPNLAHKNGTMTNKKKKKIFYIEQAHATFGTYLYYKIINHYLIYNL